MLNKSLYNRLSFALVALLYLSFYLLSPFFHYHDELLPYDKQEEYHSHLLKEAEQNKSATECHHTLAKENDHNHPLIINAVITNLPTRLIVIQDIKFLSFDLAELVIPDVSNKINFKVDLQFWKILKDKCVHSASNVSPPFAVAA